MTPRQRPRTLLPALALAVALIAVWWGWQRSPPPAASTPEGAVGAHFTGAAGGAGGEAGGAGGEAGGAKATEQAGSAAVVMAPGGCRAVSPDEGASSIDDAIAAAVLGRPDAASGPARPVSSAPVDPDKGPHPIEVADCLGARVGVDKLARVRVVSKRLEGPEALLERAGLGAARAARVLVGTSAALCEEESGFLALVSVRGREVEALATAPWSSFACGGSEGEFGVSGWGDAYALLEDGGDRSGEQTMNTRTKEVWLRRGQKLAHVGSVPVSMEQNRAFGSDPVQTKQGMIATLEPSARGLVAHETWTLRRMKLGEGGELEEMPGERPRTKRVERAYWVEGDELRQDPPDSAEP